MGKGDKKTKRGKLFKGSHGRLNPRKKKKVYNPPAVGEPAPKKKATKAKKAADKKE